MAMKLSAELQGMNKPDRAVALEGMKDLSAEMKMEVGEAIGFLSPDQTTSNRIWLLVIKGFVLVLVGSVAIMGISLFVAPAAAGTKPETILTVFTTVTAFLAGLFAPSPVPRGNDT